MLVLKGQYTRAERTSYNNIEYFTLGGCAGLKGQTPYEKATITALREYFTLGGCAGANTQQREQATITAFQRIFHTLPK